ncbi:MAG TPA: hypothetical protein H9740_05800 [Candidatus Hungatella pullicola]|nr:hypothetical protein [Candidatus Hungatella pullicola]
MSQLKKDVWKGKDVYVCSCGDMEALVSPWDGMKIYALSWKGENVIAWDESRYERRATYGVPVLYPTPNRSQGERITVGDKTYAARMHGLVKNMSFQVYEEICEEKQVALTGMVEWNENQPDYSFYPFPSQLFVTVRLTEEKAVWEYKVKNTGTAPMAYGIAIHPYFSKRGQQVKIQVPADTVMEMTEEKIPTGRLIETKGTDMDLTVPVLVDSLNLDHVYTSCRKGEDSRIYYDDMTLTLKVSEEFGHVVVFTPKGDAFCIENQSCSTDCFNLYAKGYKKQSGLLWVMPGEEKSGNIKFLFHRE